MSFKQLMFSIGYPAVWLIFLPVFVAAGGVALLTYAVFAEFGELFLGNAEHSVDHSAARETARRVCLGNG